MSESRKDLARELYESRNDPEEWGEEVEEIEVKPRRSSVLSFRLPPEELDALEQAMEQTGESLSEYIRNALALRIHASAIMPPLGTLGITYGAYNIDEDEPSQILMGDVAENSGFVIIKGSGTTASFVQRRSQNKPLMRVGAVD